MALQGKVGTEIEIKASPDKFYNVFKSTAYHVPNAAPNHIQGVEVHQGDWETHGSVKIWKYTCNGLYLVHCTNAQGQHHAFKKLKRVGPGLGGQTIPY
jgi:hypothetical protein